MEIAYYNKKELIEMFKPFLTISPSTHCGKGKTLFKKWTKLHKKLSKISICKTTKKIGNFYKVLDTVPWKKYRHSKEIQSKFIFVKFNDILDCEIEDITSISFAIKIFFSKNKEYIIINTIFRHDFGSKSTRYDWFIFKNKDYNSIEEMLKYLEKENKREVESSFKKNLLPEPIK